MATEDEYLEGPDGDTAVAAAAVIASQMAEMPYLDTAYALPFLTEGQRMELAPDLAPLAVRALDRVRAEESEWRDLWEESAEGEAMFAVVEQLREVLSS